MLIQVILLATALVLLAVFIRNSHSVRAQALKRIGFLLFLVASFYAVLRPNDTNWVAHKLGVGRGADLVLSLLVVAFAFFAVNTFLRFRNLERRFTDLVRSVALSAAVPPAAPVAPAPADGATPAPESAAALSVPPASATTPTPAVPSQARRAP